MNKPFDRYVMAERISALMKEYGDTIYTLSEYLGCTAAAVSHWTTAKYTPKAQYADLMCVRYNVSPWYLMGKIDTKHEEPAEQGDIDAAAYASENHDLIKICEDDSMLPYMAKNDTVYLRKALR